MEQALRAIANPRRRAMLELGWEGERTAGEIAARSGLSAPAASQHLKVLREAGLVGVERRGLWAYYYVTPDSAKELSTWLR
jgi:DNA-binding transcriptional ArsR family regulator